MDRRMSTMVSRIEFKDAQSVAGPTAGPRRWSLRGLRSSDEHECRKGACPGVSAEQVFEPPFELDLSSLGLAGPETAAPLRGVAVPSLWPGAEDQSPASGAEDSAPHHLGRTQLERVGD